MFHRACVPCNTLCFITTACLTSWELLSVTARNLRRNITWAFLRAVKGDLKHIDKKGPLSLCCIYKQTSTCDRFALQFICKWACRRKGDSHGTWQEVFFSKAKLCQPNSCWEQYTAIWEVTEPLILVNF